MSANLLDGIGRPDLRAKTLVSYLFMYLILAWFLVKRNGIIGAAYAWLARGMLEFFLFSAVSWKTNKFRISVFMENGLIISALVFLTFAALVSLVRFFSPGIFMPISVTVCFIVFVFFGWLYLMDDKEKAVFRLLFSVGGR
jgi:O-antigen/teichoic acid export membrane protein